MATGLNIYPQVSLEQLLVLKVDRLRISFLLSSAELPAIALSHSVPSPFFIRGLGR
jgi:hypothetical protein